MTSLTVLQFSRKEGLKLQLFHENINANTDNEGALDIIDAATTNKWEDSEEMDLLKTYLPDVIDEIKTEEIVKNTIDELGIASIKEMGKIMGTIKKNHGDNIDLSLVSQIIKKCLS